MQTPRQKEIVDAALDIINDKGIQGLTIKNISGAIKISEPAIYRHYESKEQILLAILEVFRNNTEALFSEEFEKDLPALKKIETVFTRHFASFSQTPSLVTVIFSEELFRGDAALTQKVKEIIGNNFNMLAGVIHEGQENNEIRTDVEASHIATMIMGSLRLFIKQWRFSGHTYDINKEGKLLIQSINRLICKGIYYEDQ